MKCNDKKSNESSSTNYVQQMRNEIDNKANELELIIMKINNAQSMNSKLLQIEQLYLKKQQKLNQFSNPAMNIVHLGFKCYHCGEEPIKGYRYQCTVVNCKNGNLCTKCFDENDTNEFDHHDFYEIRKAAKPQINLQLVDKAITIPKSDIAYEHKLRIINKSDVPIEYPIKAECDLKSKMKFLPAQTHQSAGSFDLNQTAIIPISFNIKGRKEGLYSVIFKLKDNDGNQLMEEQEITLTIASNQSPPHNKPSKENVRSPNQEQIMNSNQQGNNNNQIGLMSNRQAPSNNPSNRRENERDNFYQQPIDNPHPYLNPNFNELKTLNQENQVSNTGKTFKVSEIIMENKNTTDTVINLNYDFTIHDTQSGSKNNNVNEPEDEEEEEEEEEENGEFINFSNAKGYNVNNNMMNRNNENNNNNKKYKSIYDDNAYRRNDFNRGKPIISNSNLFNNEDYDEEDEEDDKDYNNDLERISIQNLRDEIKKRGIKNWISDQLITTAVDKYNDLNSQVDYILQASKF